MLQNGILTGVAFPNIFFPLCILFGIAVLIPYLLGSVNTAILVSRLFYHEDIRKKGSGNAGLTNMHRVYGKKAAGLVLLGDVLKMLLSLFTVGLFFGMQYGPYAFATNVALYVAGTACIIGHVFPVFFKFKGGKGVLCTATMVLALSPIVFAVLIAIFVLVVWVTKYISVGSMTAGLAYPFVFARVLAACGGRADILISFLTMVIALLIIYCHRSNIIRLKEKRENKFSFKRNK